MSAKERSGREIRQPPYWWRHLLLRPAEDAISFPMSFQLHVFTRRSSSQVRLRTEAATEPPTRGGSGVRNHMPRRRGQRSGWRSDHFLLLAFPCFAFQFTPGCPGFLSFGSLVLSAVEGPGFFSTVVVDFAGEAFSSEVMLLAPRKTAPSATAIRGALILP